LFEEADGYEQLIQKLNIFDEKIGACITRLFYLATPPNNYLSILKHLKGTKLSEGCGQGSEKWTRIAIEKPFGRDLDTAKELDEKLADIFEEEQIYRVDHYLGKETVQNMIAFRFANNIFEPVWNKEHIDHVQITFAQDEGIEKRGRFFDGVGIMRDVAQNHLLQLLATVAMEQPKSFSKEGVRDARARAIQAIRPIDPKEVSNSVVRGQYKEYTSETGVSENSQTETYVAMKLYVDTPRFQDVPFYVRAGKKMPKEAIEISIVFIQTCHLLFKEYGCPEIGNVLTIRIQPDEGIKLRVIAKQPGSKVALGAVDMSFSYHQAFGNHGIDAYEKLLMDIFHGDQMLFNRSDELESSWKLISHILNGWENEKSQVPVYDSGSWGPDGAAELIEKDGKKWL
jgi:glucose-6-phosphate 1-dehydrogenase